jgi:hypothetical protein
MRFFITTFDEKEISNFHIQLKKLCSKYQTKAP